MVILYKTYHLCVIILTTRAKPVWGPNSPYQYTKIWYHTVQIQKGLNPVMLTLD